MREKRTVPVRRRPLLLFWTPPLAEEADLWYDGTRTFGERGEVDAGPGKDQPGALPCGACGGVYPGRDAHLW